MLDNSKNDYKGTTVHKTHLDCSYKKRSPDCVSEIYVKIDNDPSKAISFITENMRVSQSFTRQVVHDDIH